MEIDPNTLALLSAIGGSVAKTIVDKVWNNAEKWLESYYKDHHPQAQEKAQENALDFLIDLGNRITELENDLNDKTKAKEQFLSVLSDPDFSAVLHDSVIAAARTNSKEKHQLLARIVSQKLTDDPESLQSLAANKAVEIVPHLNTEQLNILAFLSFIYYVRDNSILTKCTKEDCCKLYIDWLSERLPKLIPVKIREIDMNYLRDNSCLQVPQSIYHILNPILDEFGTDVLGCDFNKYEEFFKSELGNKLNEQWKESKRMVPNSLGFLIGLCVINEIFDEKIQVHDWF